MPTMKDGYFKKAVSGAGKNQLFVEVPLIGGIWAGLMFIRWESFFEENGAKAWAFHAWRKLTHFGSEPFPWVAVLVTVFAAYVVLSSLIQGMRGLGTPEKHDAFTGLKKFGDPYEIVEAFETEAAESPRLKWKKPLLVGTPNWLLIQNESQIVLVPVEKLRWVYDQADASEGAVGFVFTQAGVMSKRQRELAKAIGERTLSFWVEGLDDELTINVPRAQEDLVHYLLFHTENMIYGYHPILRRAWDRDRSAFKAAALAYIAAGGKAGEDDWSLFETAFEEFLKLGED